MSFAGKLFRFFIYSNLFIACCAVLMVYQTCQLLLHAAPDIYFTCFVFFATVCSYSFHWYLTPVDHDWSSPRMQWLSRQQKYTCCFFLYRPCRHSFVRLIPFKLLAMAASCQHCSLFYILHQKSRILISGN